MARRPRSYEPGLYHLAAHGSDQRDLFLSDRDREAFLDRLAALCHRFALALVSYVLLGNHYHAILRTPDDRISRTLQALHTGYSRDHNRRYGRTAHLFRAHPLLRELESDTDLANTSHYLARNPVRAGLVTNPLDWPWSSAPAHAGIEPPWLPLYEADLRDAFGGRSTWRQRYRERLTHNDEDPPKRASEVAGAGFEPATSGL